MSLLPWVLAFVGVVLFLLRNRYDRGMNKFDGPFLASFTNVWKLWNASRLSGSRNENYVDVHRRYGDVVRIGPNNVIFADPEAIPEIYGTKGSQQKVWDSMPISVDCAESTQRLYQKLDGLQALPSHSDGLWLTDVSLRCIRPLRCL